MHGPVVSAARGGVHPGHWGPDGRRVLEEWSVQPTLARHVKHAAARLLLPPHAAHAPHEGPQPRPSRSWRSGDSRSACGVVAALDELVEEGVDGVQVDRALLHAGFEAADGAVRIHRHVRAAAIRRLQLGEPRGEQAPGVGGPGGAAQLVRLAVHHEHRHRQPARVDGRHARRQSRLERAAAQNLGGPPVERSALLARAGVVHKDDAVHLLVEAAAQRLVAPVRAHVPQLQEELLLRAAALAVAQQLGVNLAARCAGRRRLRGSPSAHYVLAQRGLAGTRVAHDHHLHLAVAIWVEL
mmetsp:Transcript_44641/g.115524  ORF Transcript_44641/g.115524 Transcript_44641/m.115524 type:complete len:297 (+) Transcript_44641:615-1505(+)